MFIQKCQQNNAETVMIICFAQTIFKKLIIKYIADDTTMATGLNKVSMNFYRCFISL